MYTSLARGRAPDPQAAYEAKTRKELLGVLAKHPEGVREGELQDAYPSAAKDLVCRPASSQSARVVTGSTVQHDSATLALSSVDGGVLQATTGLQRVPHRLRTQWPCPARIGSALRRCPLCAGRQHGGCECRRPPRRRACCTGCTTSTSTRPRQGARAGSCFPGARPGPSPAACMPLMLLEPPWCCLGMLPACMRTQRGSASAKLRAHRCHAFCVRTHSLPTIARHAQFACEHAFPYATQAELPRWTAIGLRRVPTPVFNCPCSEPKLNVSLDKELIELWRKTALPADPAELDAELRRAGLVRISQPKATPTPLSTLSPARGAG